MPIYSPPGLRVQVCDSLSAVTHTSAYAVSSYPTSPVFADRIAPALGHTQASFLVANAKSRIDNICLQQTNLVCNFGRQGLSAFCTILAARASAFLIRFVKHKSRQTLSADLSADLSAISKVWGEGPRHSEAAAIMQTKFVCKYRQGNVYLKTRFV